MVVTPQKCRKIKVKGQAVQTLEGKQTSERMDGQIECKTTATKSSVSFARLGLSRGLFYFNAGTRQKI